MISCGQSGGSRCHAVSTLYGRTHGRGDAALWVPKGPLRLPQDHACRCFHVSFFASRRKRKIGLIAAMSICMQTEQIIWTGTQMPSAKLYDTVCLTANST